MTSNQAPQIVRADTTHLNDLALLFDAYRVFYGQPSDLNAARAFLSERLENGESVVFLASLQGRPVGFTQLYPSFSSVTMRRLWILNDLFVAQEGRRSGVGAALLERARQHGADTNAVRLVLQTAVDNFAAQALYEREGWRRDQEFYAYNLSL